MVEFPRQYPTLVSREVTSPKETGRVSRAGHANQKGLLAVLVSELRTPFAGGESIFGGNFEDESFEVLHNKLYLLSLANRGPNTNQSQFFINTVKTSWLDKKNVVFGMVLEGFDLVDDIEAVGTNAGDPLGLVTVTDSGVLDTMQAAIAATSEKRR